MIRTIMENGFAALAAYTFVFSMMMLVLFIVAAIVNACTRRSKFNIEEIRKILVTNLVFMALFALLDYFLVP